MKIQANSTQKGVSNGEELTAIGYQLSALSFSEPRSPGYAPTANVGFRFPAGKKRGA